MVGSLCFMFGLRFHPVGVIKQFMETKGSSNLVGYSFALRSVTGLATAHLSLPKYIS
jgi:hypothetical protein